MKGLILSFVIAQATASSITAWMMQNRVQTITRSDLSPQAASSVKSPQPGLVFGAFRPDYATAALLRKVKDTIVFQIAGCKGNACGILFEHDLSRYAGIVYLKKVPAGYTVHSADGGRSVKLHLDGVEVHYFEKAAVVYFWNQSGKWESIGIAD